MPGRVFVTGGSGFVGEAIIDELLARNYAVTALVNRRPLPARDRVRQVQGDIFDDRALDQGMAGADAVMHLVGIIMERPRLGITFERIHARGTRRVVDAAKRNGVRRFVHMSALGTRPGAPSRYHRTKFEAEEYVRHSGLDWTIFRPSLIHGPRGEFMRMEAKWARYRSPPFLFMPYFGAGLFGRRGAGLLQPVYIGDVARAFVDALENRRTIGNVYPLGGPDRLTWPQLHHAVARAVLGRKRIALPIPVWAAKLNASFLPVALLGYNRDQVLMSQEDNTTDLSKFINDFGWEPRAFEPTLREYAGRL